MDVAAMRRIRPAAASFLGRFAVCLSRSRRIQVAPAAQREYHSWQSQYRCLRPRGRLFRLTTTENL